MGHDRNDEANGVETMRCFRCNRKIRAGYFWLGKIWCYRCFTNRRGEAIRNKEELPWHYEMVTKAMYDEKFYKKLDSWV